MPTQTAIQVTQWRSDDLDGAAISQVPIPEPKEGEALVRILLRPVNPTDLVTLHGARAATIQLPTTPGSEGDSRGHMQPLSVGPDRATHGGLTGASPLLKVWGSSNVPQPARQSLRKVNALLGFHSARALGSSL